MPLRHGIGSRVLIVSPKSTLQNWAEEADSWCTRCHLGRMRVRTLDDNCKRPEDRRDMLAEWLRCGGLLLMGYEMFTTLSGVSKRGRSCAPPSLPPPCPDAGLSKTRRPRVAALLGLVWNHRFWGANPTAKGVCSPVPRRQDAGGGGGQCGGGAVVGAAMC